MFAGGAFVDIIFVVAFISFSSFWWSIYGVFRKVEDKNKLGLVVLKIASALTWLYILYSIYSISNLNQPYAILGLFLSCSSLLLFWYLAYLTKNKKLSVVYSNDNPVFLIKDGVYKYIRHPFYLSYLLNYFSFWIITQDNAILIFVVAMLVIYIKAMKVEELKFLNSDLEEAYRKYKKAAGSLYPKFKK